MSANPNDELQGQLGESEEKMKDGLFNQNQTYWTVLDEAIHRGNNYAQQHAKAHLDAVRYREATMHAILKNAYQEGFLHGFEHKFEQHNYEEK